MRRLLTLASLALCLACGSDVLGPVTVADGNWSGTHSGYTLSITMVQSGTDVTGNAVLAGVAGVAQGTLTGTFVYPNLNVTISLAGGDILDFSYAGVMSSSEASIAGQLNGSGFENLQFDVAKKK